MFYEFIGKAPLLDTGKIYFLTIRNTPPYPSGGIIAKMVDFHNKELWSAAYNDYTSFRLSWRAV